MRTPAAAVLWETWRLTRARLLVVPSLATICGWVLARLPTNPLIFVILFAAGFAMALSLPLFGERRAFPLSRAFARPIRTTVLVAVPLAYVFLSAVASYLVPAVVLRTIGSAPLPLSAPAMLIGTLAVLVAGCSWSTRLTTVRIGLAFAGVVVAFTMLQYLHPFSEAGGFPLKLGPQLCVLSAQGYALLSLFIVGVYTGITFGVGQQRHGDEEAAQRGSSTDKTRENGADIFVWLRNASMRLLRWRCPTSSPMAAELWFEMQCYGTTVLLVGVLLALAVPVVMYGANASRSWIAPLSFTIGGFTAPFLVGVGASIWNRRNSWQSRLATFDAARPIGTGTIVGLQILLTSLCIAGAWALMLVSAWLSLPLISDLHDYGSSASVAASLFHRYGMRTVSFVAVSFVGLATVIALLAALRTFGSAYGWRLWVSALGVVLYAIALLISVGLQYVDASVLGANVWLLAIAIPLGTLFVLARALKAAALTLRQIAVAAVVWSAFAVLYLDMLRAGGTLLQASEAFEALTLASTLLPLLATGLAPWSLTLVRHA